MSGPNSRAHDRRPHVILPAPAGRTSGGFLVNGRLFAPGEHAVVYVSTTDGLAHELDALGRSDVAVVDSLFLFETAQAETLVRAARRSRIILIAHSLPSLIPGTTAASRLHLLSLERAFLSVCAGALAPSAFMAAALNRRGLVHEAIAVIPPAPICDGRGTLASVDAPPTAPRPALGREVGRSDPPIQVLTVANWSPAKGVAHAARALAIIADLEWRWTVIGSRDEESGYADEIVGCLASEGLEARVELVQPVPPDELAGYYRRADLFVLPSLMESYGLVYAESLSYGVPIVGYRAAAVEEVVGDAGILVPAGRVDLLAQAIRDFFTGDAYAPATTRADDRVAPTIAILRDRAVARAASLPRWQTVGTRFTAAIARLCTRRPAKTFPGANSGESPR
ncbi:MAG: glycosyltransferase family 4 protein [Spirochaetota bacterium]